MTIWLRLLLALAASIETEGGNLLAIGPNPTSLERLSAALDLFHSRGILVHGCIE
jgi:hypothetical protein